MERVFADATEAGDEAAPGPRAHRARRERPHARRRPAARARAGRAGARHPRRRPRGGSVRGAGDARAGSAGGSATSKTTSVGSARRSRSRARSVARTWRRAPSTSSRAPRSRGSISIAGCGSWPRRSSSRRRAATSPPSAGRSSRRPGSTALRGRLDEAAAGLDQAEELFSQSGQRLGARPAQQPLRLGRAPSRAISPAADRRFRDAIRILKPLEDRGTLCESQRGLAQILVALKKIDEAERYALEARETVGPHDTISRATTRMALGIVRAAQGHDEEAEALLREAVAVVDGKDAAPDPSRARDCACRVPARARPRRRGRGVRGRARRATPPRSRPPEPRRTALIACVDASSGDSEITVAGRSKRASASRSGSARSVPSP